MNRIRFIIALMATLILSGCYKTIERTTKIKQRIPIYQFTTEAEAEANLIQGAPKSLTTFGNIYTYQHYLLINERGTGVHIFDNSNPDSPHKISFMNIPGNFDMAIRNNVLYVDSYDDLLALDVSDITNIQLLNRVDAIFPASHPSRSGVIIGYKDTIIEISEEINPNWGFGNNEDDNGLSFSTSESFSNNSVNPTNSNGTGGSFARFTIANSHLFAIDSRTLNIFDLAIAGDPKKVKSEVIFNVAEIETVFPYQNSLFIGSTDGVIIYDITNPANIVFESMFTHARACDPVYVSEDVAYVTLRSNNNNRCFGVNNQLDILNVKDLDLPRLIQTFPMINPHGVGVDDSLLFICEADAGLKIFDINKTFTNNELTAVSIDQISWNQSIFAYDVIPQNGNLIVVGENELHQYDYTDPTNITLRSKIE
ncbi:MAG: hypothetical protein ACJARP_001985 [Vicingaceae bacterium]|jgi:hypothetical protein